MAGLNLDPWQADTLTDSLGEREDGSWAAFEVGVDVARQNGKDGLLEGRELTGLFLLEEELIIHTAHQFDTSLEHFRRLLELIESTPDFDRRVKRVSRSHGEEGIELKGGQRIRFRTRTKGGGRGFSGDLVIFNEAMDISSATHAAILPVLSARSVHGSPQVWYAGSPVDQWTHENGLVFARVRERGIAGDDPSLMFVEFSPDCGDPSAAGEFLDDHEAWAQANPALGIRISLEHVERERRSMDDRTFAVERLGIGDWPSTDPEGEQVLDRGKVAACVDAKSQALDPLNLAVDVTPDRSRAAIGAAGKRSDGLTHIEVIDHKSGTKWVVPALVKLKEVHGVERVRLDGSGPAASLIDKIEEADIEVEALTAKEHGQACGEFFDAFDQTSVRHLATPELEAAFRGAAKRPLGDAWAWSRKSSTVDISPLVAVTLAHWGASSEPKTKEPLVAWRSRGS